MILLDTILVKMIRNAHSHTQWIAAVDSALSYAVAWCNRALRFLNGRFGALIENVTEADLQSPELGQMLRRTWLQAGLSGP